MKEKIKIGKIYISKEKSFLRKPFFINGDNVFYTWIYTGEDWTEEKTAQGDIDSFLKYLSLPNVFKS